MAILYSPLKFMHYPDRLEALRKNRLSAPVHVRIKPINRCNHKCWYCAYRSDDLKLGEDMDEQDTIPPEKMAEIVEDLIAMKVEAVTFSGGGEPLLYKSLPATIERLAEGGVRVATLTNGANLKGRMADALAAHATWVRVSVDAWDDDSYMKSRGARQGEFSSLLDNLRAFAALRSRCVLGVSLIIGRENHHRVAEVCRLFKDMGVNHVKLSAAVVGNDTAENNRYHREFAAAARSQIDQAKALADDRFAVLNHYHELEERFEKTYTRCPFLNFLTVIGADLNVYTCQDKAYTRSGTLGSIKNRRFKEFWFSDEARDLVSAFDPSRSCEHHCVSHAKNLALVEYLSVDTDHGAFV
jgi:MoaA/NifB/PqqE/SkfB family radical SAM enzyme